MVVNICKNLFFPALESTLILHKSSFSYEIFKILEKAKEVSHSVESTADSNCWEP